MEYWVKLDEIVDGYHPIYCRPVKDSDCYVGGVNVADMQRAVKDNSSWIRCRVLVEDFGDFKRFLESKLPFGYWNTVSNGPYITFDVCYCPRSY
jgi:hypothetical protein